MFGLAAKASNMGPLVPLACTWYYWEFAFEAYRREIDLTTTAVVTLTRQKQAWQSITFIRAYLGKPFAQAFKLATTFASLAPFFFFIEMEAALRQILVDRNGVNADTVKWLEDNHCLTVANFANWVDSKSEIKDMIHQKIPSVKDNVADLANTKMAWREADAQVSRGVKRAADGLESEAIDDPLQIEIFKAIKKTFKTCYNWADSFDSRRIGCDALHGRFRREFERKQPTMFVLLKARSLAKSQKEGKIQKTRLDNNIEIHQKDKDGYDGPSSLAKWFACFDIVVNTWAVTGCFDVPYQGETRKYVHWAEVQAYQFEFIIKANELTAEHYQEHKVLSYLSTVEEEIRSKAVELARGGDECPWGEALTSARKDCAHLWQERRNKLASKITHQETFKDNYPPRTASYQKQPYQKGEFCKFFNKGTCNGSCGGATHACNVVLANGKHCGAKNHNATTHEIKHGIPKNHIAQEGKGKKGKGGKRK